MNRSDNGHTNACPGREKALAGEFHARYNGEKPYFEFWDGEAIQKSMPTRLHSLIRKILLRLLDALGYEAGQEITLKLDPTEAFEVAIEILSPEDSFSRLLRKCSLYRTWGIRQVVVIDPKARLVWSFETRGSCGNKSTGSSIRRPLRNLPGPLILHRRRLLHT